MPAQAIAVGSAFPIVCEPAKKWRVHQIGFQWLVLYRTPSHYQVRGVFLTKEDARTFKKAAKKQLKKDKKTRSKDGPGS